VAGAAWASERGLLSASASAQGERADAEQVQKIIEPERPELPAVTIAQPDLRFYDALIGAGICQKFRV